MITLAGTEKHSNILSQKRNMTVFVSSVISLVLKKPFKIKRTHFKEDRGPVFCRTNKTESGVLNLLLKRI